MADILLQNVRPMGAAATNVLIREGRIATIGTNLTVPGDMRAMDGMNGILIPGLVDAHTHLDKNLLGLAWQPHGAGPRILDRIENEQRLRRSLKLDAERQSRLQVELANAAGTTRIRSHVDVGLDVGLRSIEGVAATREKLRDRVDIEIVAFPQAGIIRQPGVDRLLNDAMSVGADIVGGIDPSSLDGDARQHLDTIFGIADTHGKPVDIHLHEMGATGATSLAMILERTRALGMKGKVAISHAFCLGDMSEAALATIVEQLVDLDVTVVTTAPLSAPTPPIGYLLKAGVRVAAGSDGVRDSWSPFGNADMLDRAALIAMRNNFRNDDDVAATLEVATRLGATLTGMSNYGCEVGDVADLVLLNGETLAEAIVSRRPRVMVMKRGRVLYIVDAATTEPQ